MNSCCNTATQTPEQTSVVKPRYSVQSAADNHFVRVELPGVKKDQVSINLDQDVLSVRANRSTAAPADWKPLHRELNDLNYLLRLKLNAPVDEAKLSATLEDGVLTLSLPVKETAKPRTIPVS